jgi:hypothetical protein
MTDKVNKEVSLIGRDFGDFRKNLIDFAKNYFPETYNDFNESSPGMMFIEMASYVGDVLSYYTDVQLRESILEQAQEKGNVFLVAQSMGYKPKLNVPATTILTIYQIIPSQGSGDNVSPNFDYALKIKEGMKVNSATNQDIQFSTTQKVDFAFSSSFDPTEVTVYQTNETTTEPTYYLLKKYVKAVSGEEITQDFTFGSPKIYDKIRIEDENLIDVVNIVDDNGDTWYKVPYLAQDTIFEQVPNSSDYSLNYNLFAGETPYLLRLKRVPKRYITRIEEDGSISIQFGAGISSNADEEILPNPDNVGSALYPASGDLDQGIDPSNFMYSKTYGVAPSNSTLTVTYRIGNGVLDNVPSRDLTEIDTVVFENTNQFALDSSILNVVQNSVAVTNESAAGGGKYEEEIEQVRQNAMAYFAAQNRAVTKEDYVLRAYALPPQFGSVSKAFLAPDWQVQTLLDDGPNPIANPLALNLYVLGYDSDRKLKNLNAATKENLKNYLSYYRILTDAVNIKNAYVVNVGVEFEIIVLPNYNSNEVLLKCINALKDYFNIDKRQINQPIMLSEIYILLDRIDGVQTVVRPDRDGVGGLQIVNKWDGVYSPNKYDVKNATTQGIVYPPKDPSIFEIKYPDLDIKGKVVPMTY